LARALEIDLVKEFVPGLLGGITIGKIMSESQLANTSLDARLL
jgi:hypothetical protein